MSTSSFLILPLLLPSLLLLPQICWQDQSSGSCPVGKFVLWPPLLPSPFSALPHAYPSSTCSCPPPALAFLMGRTQAQVPQMIVGKLGVVEGKVARKAGLILQGIPTRLMESIFQHPPPSFLSFPKESMLPSWGLSPSLLSTLCLLSPAVTDSIHLYPHPTSSLSWLLRLPV